MQHSPRINRIAWGSMEVEDLGAGKDYKLWPGGGRPWDWRETGTSHVPGILPGDVAELLQHGSNIVVLSRGMLRCLHASREVLAMLDAAGATVHIAETRRAAAIYNDLAERGERVGGLFHSTC